MCASELIDAPAAVGPLLVDSPTLIEVTADDIARGERGSVSRNPLALAITRVRGELTAVQRGPSVAGGHSDERIMPEGYRRNTTWFAVIGEKDIPLPGKAQCFADIWRYGPGCGIRYPVRNEAGAVIARHTYGEIVRPFTFRLALLEVLA